jgi:hypothetical protein
MMIMARTQRFQIRETVPGLPGELVCYGCGAGQTMDEDTGDSPAGALIMEHTEDCGEVRRLAAGG